MIIAIGLYQGFTALDAIGPYEILTYLPDAEMVLCAESTGVVDDHNDLVHLRIDKTFADVPAPMCSSCPAALSPVDTRQRVTPSLTGSARPIRTLRGRRRYAPAHYCSAPPGC